jgi:hypothetical protein
LPVGADGFVTVTLMDAGPAGATKVVVIDEGLTTTVFADVMLPEETVTAAPG